MTPADGAGAAVDTPPAPQERREGARRSLLTPQRREALRGTARDVGPAIAVYVAIRLVGLLALAVMARHHGYGAFTRLNTYDAPRLLRVADRGYDPLIPRVVDGRPATSSIAFFPLYPLVVKIVSWVPGVSLLAAGYLVTAVSGLVAAAGLDRFGRRLVGGRLGGLLIVALWSLWPHSIVLDMTYTEALFVALAVWSMLALLDGRWVAAGVLCLFAGATRSLGVSLAGALILTAAVAVVRAVRDRRGVPWRPIAGAVLAPLGFLGYLAYQWARTGRPDAWFWVQSVEWRSSFDGGRFTVATIAKYLTHEGPLVMLVASLVVLGSIVLFVALVAEGAPLPVVVYPALAIILTFGTENYMNSKSRFLLCAFPLVVPLARALRGSPRRTLIVLLVGLTLLSAWYNAWVLVVWRFSP